MIVMPTRMPQLPKGLSFADEPLRTEELALIVPDAMLFRTDPDNPDQWDPALLAEVCTTVPSSPGLQYVELVVEHVSFKYFGTFLVSVLSEVSHMLDRAIELQWWESLKRRQGDALSYNTTRIERYVPIDGRADIAQPDRTPLTVTVLDRSYFEASHLDRSGWEIFYEELSITVSDTRSLADIEATLAAGVYQRADYARYDALCVVTRTDGHFTYRTYPIYNVMPDTKD